MKLVFVHGRDQQGKKPQALLQEWMGAWQRGIRAADLPMPDIVPAFPFYGDLLDQLRRQADAAEANELVARGGEPDPKEAAFRGSIIEEIAKKQHIDRAQIDPFYHDRPQPRGPENWEWVQAILRALDQEPFVSEWTINSFTRDVYLYLMRPAIRKQIDAVVRPHLEEGPCVVVAHSLGTVVAYNVLRTMPAGREFPLFATVGSPLAVTAIKANIERPLQVPTGVKKWFNAMDERDVVALYPLDPENFDVEPPIENKTNVRNDTKNRHGISGYLSDRTVAREILEALG